jgi:hypothetical protein
MPRLLLCISVYVLVALPASSDSPRHATGDVEKLIKQLGSNSFSEWEAASKTLEDIGEPAVQSLQEAARSAADGGFRARHRNSNRPAARRSIRTGQGQDR